MPLTKINLYALSSLKLKSLRPTYKQYKDQIQPNMLKQ